MTKSGTIKSYFFVIIISNKYSLNSKRPQSLELSFNAMRSRYQVGNERVYLRLKINRDQVSLKQAIRTLKKGL